VSSSRPKRRRMSGPEPGTVMRTALAARAMGGELRVVSEGIDKGAAFTLELPINAQGGATCLKANESLRIAPGSPTAEA